MIRITKESEYAFLLLSALLRQNNEPKSAVTLASATNLAIPMTGKVLKRLVKGDILRSARGAYGGYQLSRRPEEISALEVVQAIEGSPELVACVHGEATCALAQICNISPFWQQLNEEINQLLAQRTLADMQLVDKKRPIK